MDDKVAVIEGSPQMAPLAVGPNEVGSGLLQRLPDGVFQRANMDVGIGSDEKKTIRDGR